MQRIHLLRVEAPAAEFAALFESARTEGMRLGWLQWDPEGILGAAREGAAIVVRAAADGESTQRRRRGQPVLQDILRRHFLGCLAVLVVGESDSPLLEPRGEAFRVTAGATTRDLPDATALLQRLRRPRPWG